MKRTFEEVWAEKELQGFRYGRDALENVRFGYELGLAEAEKRCMHVFEDDRCVKCGGVA